MNWDFIIKYLPMYERAALLTVKLGLAGVICAIIVGLICAIIQYEKVPVARQIVPMKCSSPELSQTGSYFWKAEKYKKMKHQMSFSNTRRQIGRRNS